MQQKLSQLGLVRAVSGRESLEDRRMSLGLLTLILTQSVVHLST